MSDNRNPSRKYLEDKKILFNRTIDAVYETIFEGKIPSKLSISILEGILVGVSLNLNFVESQPKSTVQAMYKSY